MDNNTPCANTYFLNKHLLEQEHNDARAAALEIVIDNNTDGRLASLQPNDMQALFGDIGTLSVIGKPAPDEELFNEVAQNVANYFTEKTPENARKIGASLATFLLFTVHADETLQAVDRE